MTGRRAILWLCMLALVLAQAVGFMHRVVHAPHAVAAGADAHPAHHWVHGLFAAHEDDSTCRLLDSLAQDGVAQPAAAAPVLGPAPVLIARAEGGFVSRRADLFQARGPPASSFA